MIWSGKQPCVNAPPAELYSFVCVCNTDEFSNQSSSADSSLVCNENNLQGLIYGKAFIEYLHLH